MRWTQREASTVIRPAKSACRTSAEHDTRRSAVSLRPGCADSEAVIRTGGGLHGDTDWGDNPGRLSGMDVSKANLLVSLAGGPAGSSTRRGLWATVVSSCCRAIPGRIPSAWPCGSLRRVLEATAEPHAFGSHPGTGRPTRRITHGRPSRGRSWTCFGPRSKQLMRVQACRATAGSGLRLGDALGAAGRRQRSGIGETLESEGASATGETIRSRSVPS